MKKYILYSLSLLIILVSCNSEDDTPSIMDTFHEDYYSVNIAPTINNFKIDIEKQIELTNTLKTSTTLENFNALQAHKHNG